MTLRNITGLLTLTLGLGVACGLVRAVDPATLPVITVNGLVTLFGQPQVLFQTPGAEPGKVGSYVLGLHERQNGIQVLEIDAATHRITFDNHGERQQLALTTAAATSAAGGSDTNTTNEVVAANVPKHYPPDFIRAHTPEYLGGGLDGSTNGLSLAITNLETRMILIEAQREYLISKGDPAANDLPATALTPSNQ
ncbi:MAG TPA: hypothetical protein VF607_06095 [Verrucomicrobiae bacterium]